MKAKSVFERDLTELRAKRAEREKAAGVQRLRQSSKEPQEVSGSPSVTADAIEAAMNNGDDMTEAEPTNLEDVVMLDESIEPIANTVEPTPSSTSMDAHHIKTWDEAPSQPDEDLAKPEDPPKVFESVSTAPNKETSSHIATQEVNFTAPQETSPLETPTTANIRDAAFESMFNDTELAGTQDTLDFDLDFPTDANIDEDLLTDNPFGAMDSSTADLSNLQNTSNEDINTLLPGLENYVNAGDAFQMMDFTASTPTLAFEPLGSSTSTTLAPSATAPGATGTQMVTGDNPATDQAPADQNYNDMFFGTGELGMGNSDDVDMAGDENIGDCEFDDWFGNQD